MCKILSKCLNSDNFVLSSGVKIRNEGESVQHSPIPQYNRLDKNKYTNYTRQVNMFSQMLDQLTWIPLSKTPAKTVV